MEDWEQCCEVMTGYSVAVLRGVSRQVDVDVKKLYVTLCLLHLNVSYEQLACIVRSTTNGKVLDESSIRKRYVNVVLDANEKKGSLADVNRRFCVTDPDFKDCFCIVDGVPVYCRGPHSLFNNKQHDKYLSFQWYCMLDGCPLAITGPVEGSMHDSDAVCLTKPFNHKDLELILADLAYISVRHMLTQKKGSLGSPQDEWYDMEFRRVRNRVERVFGGLDKHRVLWYSLFSKEVIAQIMLLIFNAECVRWQLEPPDADSRYADAVVYLHPKSPDVLAWVNSPDCACAMFKGDKDFERTMDMKRDNITSAIWLKKPVVPTGKRSAHGKSGQSKTYVRRAKQEMKQHKHDLCVLRASDKKENKKTRLKDQAAALAEYKADSTPLYLLQAKRQKTQK